MGANNIDPVTLIFEFGLLFENFRFANNFLNMQWLSARIFIFYMNIPCDKIFLLVLLTYWPWHLTYSTLDNF